MKNVEILLSSHFTLQHLAKMLTRKGTHIPFIEEEKHVRVPKPPTMETRASSLIPIIDEPLVEELTGNRLPLSKEVFSHFFFLHCTKKMVLHKAKREAVKSASSFWEKISITPKKIDNGVMMLTRLPGMNEHIDK